jgi:hypothetical protein
MTAAALRAARIATASDGSFMNVARRPVYCTNHSIGPGAGRRKLGDFHAEHHFPVLVL